MYNHPPHGYYAPYTQDDSMQQESGQQVPNYPPQYAHCGSYPYAPQSYPPGMGTPAWSHPAAMPDPRAIHHMHHHGAYPHMPVYPAIAMPPYYYPQMPHPAGYPQGIPPMGQSAQTEGCQPSDTMMQQAQSLFDGVLGEDAGAFKAMLGKFGINDKEFWKGAMVGAAAAMLLNNDTVRSKLMGLITGASDLLKTGEQAGAEQVAENAQQMMHSAQPQSEIFREHHTEGVAETVSESDHGQPYGN
ncbi:hypothetical protein NFHSH190041_16710 [Shewanella sp. NFH-SH190041]|uniref:hypothetical protein n=1 Tax=Shewanella sp. NFH-SH190041 TaxID=2950245 RepID=UPI0021C4397E|nr:hypothetical protein [Shewanella sp. NFH-SH190041]BDM64219.1 hypothetical protein NFHSH190041_16710 [Shewanella sp. NFH-SH190041]